MIIMITYTRLVPNSVVDSPPVAFSTFNKTKTKRFHRQQSDHSRRELEQFWDLIHRRVILTMHSLTISSISVEGEENKSKGGYFRPMSCFPCVQKSMQNVLGQHTRHKIRDYRIRVCPIF